MSELRQPIPVMPVFSIFSADLSAIEQAEHDISGHWGAIFLTSELLDFTQTAYYEREFGHGLKRIFLALKDVIDPTGLVDMKLWACRYEQKHTVNEKRLLNIDPGILSCERLVLATGKNYTHRIYLGKRVWADLTLIYQKGSFRALPWTYPDYSSDETILFWNMVRREYMNIPHIRHALKNQY